MTTWTNINKELYTVWFQYKRGETSLYSVKMIKQKVKTAFTSKESRKRQRDQREAVGIGV